MGVTALYAVIQLAVLTAPTRSVRFDVLLAAASAGIVVAGPVVLLLELAFDEVAGVVLGLTGEETVRLAGYTAAPVIEEIVKVAPVVAVALVHRRSRERWNLTDHLALAACAGVGFGLLEQLLRVAGLSAWRHGGPLPGWSVPLDDFRTWHVPGLADLPGSFLPEPLTTDSLGLGDPTRVYPHVVWSLLVGLGVGLILRASRGWRLAGVGLIVFAVLDHCANNYELFTGGDPGPLGRMRSLLGLYAVVAILAAVVVDARRARTDPAMRRIAARAWLPPVVAVPATAQYVGVNGLVPMVYPVLAVLAASTLLWLGLRAVTTGLPSLSADPSPPVTAARAELRVLAGLAAMIVGVGCNVLSFTQMVSWDALVIDPVMVVGRFGTVGGLLIALWGLLSFPPMGFVGLDPRRA